MSQNSKEDAFASWVDLAISITTSTFSREGNLEREFLDVSPSSDQGVLIPEESKRIYSEYGNCTIIFYKCNFSLMGLRLPFNSFEPSDYLFLTCESCEMSLH